MFFILSQKALVFIFYRVFFTGSPTQLQTELPASAEAPFYFGTHFDQGGRI